MTQKVTPLDTERSSKWKQLRNVLTTARREGIAVDHFQCFSASTRFATRPAFSGRCMEALASEQSVVPYKLLVQVVDAVKKVVEARLRLFSSK